MDIREALANLDQLNDDHWTKDGAPRTDVVSDLLGQQVTRQAITDAAPKFSRENADLTLNEQDEEPVLEPVMEEPEVDFYHLLDEEPVDPDEFPSLLKSVHKDQLTLLSDALHEQAIQLTRELEVLKEKIRRVHVNRSTVLARNADLNPEASNQHAIQEYIRSQNQLRAAKRAATAEILKNVDLKHLDPRAPIDQAFSRKTGRGGQRPKV